MNNNRGGNNRRRGRSNNNTRPQGSNGGQQVNRIDSRARGNAPQMLEKYRKLANDAHLNGDRVNAEYYLQFADHYFRVIADTRVRQEEQRLRRDDRWQEGDGAADDNDDSADFGVETEFASFDQPPVYTRREREDRPERSERTNPERIPSQSESQRRDGPAGEQQAPRPYNRQNEPAPPQFSAGEKPAAEPVEAAGNGDGGDTVTAYEPPENPFLRENRSGRGLRPRREDRRPRREDRPDTVPVNDAPDHRAMRAISAGIDPDTLPPSFTAPRAEPPVADAAAEAPVPRRRAPRRKAAIDDAGEPIQSLT